MRGVIVNCGHSSFGMHLVGHVIEIQAHENPHLHEGSVVVSSRSSSCTTAKRY
jgi:hypothetical protein